MVADFRQSPTLASELAAGPAKRGIEVVGPIHEDCTGLDATSESLGALGIGGPQRRGEAEIAVIHQPERLVIALHLHDADHRRKGLVTHDPHRMVHLGQDLRREIGAAVILRQDADMRRGAGLHCLGDLGAGLVREASVGHGSECGLLFERASQPVGLGKFHRPVDEGVVVGGVDVNSLDPAAALAGVVHGTVHERAHGGSEVGIFHHVAWILAAKLEAEAGKGTGRGLLDGPAAFHGAREIHEIERPFTYQRQGGVVRQEQVLEHLLRHASGVERIRQALADKEGLRGMLEHHGVAGDQRRKHRVDRGHVGIVPRSHYQDEASGLATDRAAEPGTVFHLDIPERRRGDGSHVGRALIESAPFAAIADRASHLPRELRHDLVVLGADAGNSLQDEIDALLHGPRRPRPLSCPGARHDRPRRVISESWALGVHRPIDGGDALQLLGHRKLPVRPKVKRTSG